MPGETLDFASVLAGYGALAPAEGETKVLDVAVSGE
jgi:hypothetical protein